MASDWIITPEARIAFPNLFTPKADDRNKLWYSCALIFEAGTDLSDVKKAAFDAAAAKLKGGAEEAKMRFRAKSDGLRWPLRDTEEKQNLGYPAGGHFMNVKTKEKPGIVDSKLRDIIDPSEIYAGCYVVAQISPWFYNEKGNAGVTFFLSNLQKTRDGQRMAGAPSAKAVFSVIGDDETVKTENTSPDEFDDILG